ncbi:hypothetical protein A2I96_17210 [Pseudoalteromonas tetraodonis]|uniref:DUF6161 domain-containing protein n=1 Tax=Pseudoalteromonas tetraodonis TaxID=43659 RepID=A0ABD4EN37_9GAMM|nr:DUF6161 domain-containing protein [Pseudoalteromonas spiralis]KYL32755.1 hypothetical protein A2I96_17210 [Pseudoalteromonas spiralis]
MSEEIEQEETKLKRITIKTENGSRWFDESAKLLAWIQEQRQLYQSLQRNGQQKQQYQIQQLFNTFEQSWSNLQQQVTQGLQRFQSDPSNYNNKVDQFAKSFNAYLENKQLFTEEAAFIDFIQRQESKSIEHGLAAIAVAFDFNVVQIDRKMFNALSEAEAYFSGSKERVTDESESLGQLRERWDTEFSEQREKMLADNNAELLELIEHKVNADKVVAKWQEQTESQTIDLQEHKNQFKTKFDQELSNAKDDLENLTKTYDDNLALHASVRYWGIQQKSHDDKAKLYAKALGATTVVVLLTIILFAIFGLDKPFKEVAVSRLVTAAAITTFGIWIIKIVGNIFMSHLHLATDAQERRTMIHTYLALTRKGQGPKEEDRQLILQTLFRPSTTDMVKNDQGPTQLVDLINRLSPKQ